jgi:hypothetical protein
LKVIIGTSMRFIFVFDKNGDDKQGTEFPLDELEKEEDTFRGKNQLKEV